MRRMSGPGNPVGNNERGPDFLCAALKIYSALPIVVLGFFKAVNAPYSSFKGDQDGCITNYVAGYRSG